MDFHRSLCYWKAAKLARDLSHRQVQSFVFRIWYDIYISFLDWVGIIHSGIIFSFLSSTFFFWRRNLLYRFHSSSFFFWNSVRIWFWMIPNGLIHQCPGTGSCSVVKKVTMSEKKYKWNTISPGRDFDIFCRWVLQIKQLIYTISLANRRSSRASIQW